MRLLKHPRLGHPRAGYAQIGWSLAAGVLSYLAGKLLAKKQKSPIDSDKPTTLTTRGAHANYLVGIARLGPVFSWAGERESKKEKVSGGKGFGGGQKQDVWYESGWHVLGSNGPYFALHEIVQTGKRIFKGPITRDSHPSGSTVDLGKEGVFTIYWGEEDQPINTFLGAAGRVTVSSRWPFMCYIVWNKKRLGTSPQWPILDYVFEQRPNNAVLTGSTGYIAATETLTGDIKSILSHTNGAQGVGKFTFNGDVTKTFKASRPVELAGNSMTSGRYVVLRSNAYQFEVTPPNLGLVPPFPGSYVTRTDVFLYGGVTGANDAGTLQAYVVKKDDGINPAHGIAEVLFAQWPQGLGYDPSGNEPFNLPSLEALGVEAATDRLVTVWLGVDGENVDALLGAGLQDLGVMVPFELSGGTIKFERIRFPVGTLPNISYDLQANDLPEVETLHAERPADRLVFKFTDRQHDYSDMTIAVDDDGQASFAEYQRAREIGIKITNNFATASQIAERRSQEELAGGGAITIKGNRGCRELTPGQAIIADGFDDVLRVTAVGSEPLESAVSVKCIPDFYGSKKSDFENNQGGGQPSDLDAQPDLQAAIFEVPEILLAGDPMTIIVPRIRASTLEVGADMHLSRDNITYSLNSQDIGIQTGGTLDTAFTSSSAMEEDQGPTITALGPDVATALDLSADITNWRLGRQLCAISSSAGTEICFLKKLTAMGGSTYRLDGLIRGRYDTTKLNHPIGAEVYIFEQADVSSMQDILLEPDQLLYVKTQPNTGAGQVPLASITPDTIFLYGKGLKPMELTAVELTAPALGSPSYGTGQSLALRWGYRSANELTSGAGQQPAGTPTGIQTPLGAFTVEFLTTADVLKRTIAVTGTNVLAYSNTELVTDFGSEVSLKVRVTQTVAGYTTPAVTLTVTKV